MSVVVLLTDYLRGVIPERPLPDRNLGLSQKHGNIPAGTSTRTTAKVLLLKVLVKVAQSSCSGISSKVVNTTHVLSTVTALSHM